MVASAIHQQISTLSKSIGYNLMKAFNSFIL